MKLNAFKGSARVAPTTGKVYQVDDIGRQNEPQIPNDRSLGIKRYNRFFRYD
jgi:hypothetical protein